MKASSSLLYYAKVDMGLHRFNDDFHLLGEDAPLQDVVVSSDSQIHQERRTHPPQAEFDAVGITRLGMLLTFWEGSRKISQRRMGVPVPVFSESEILAALDTAEAGGQHLIVDCSTQDPETFKMTSYSRSYFSSRGRGFDFSGKVARQFPVKAHAAGLAQDWNTAKVLVQPRLQTILTHVYNDAGGVGVLRQKQQKYTRLILPNSTGNPYPPDRLLIVIRHEHSRPEGGISELRDIAARHTGQ